MGYWAHQEYRLPAEHLIFYLDFEHRIADIVADDASDLAMPAEQQLGMDWRLHYGVPLIVSL